MRCTSYSLLVPLMAIVVHVACGAALAQGPTYNRGRTASAEEIRAWDSSISPDGKELPPGNGIAKEGAKVWAQRCAKCHGADGTGRAFSPTMSSQGGASPLVGRKDTLGGLRGRPFATTIWDFTNRAMPLGEGGTLSADEVYAVTAYLLYLNSIIQESDVMDSKSLPKVQMPNRKSYPVDEIRRWQVIDEPRTQGKGAP